jgi:hypothetical protein
VLIISSFRRLPFIVSKRFQSDLPFPVPEKEGMKKTRKVGMNTTQIAKSTYDYHHDRRNLNPAKAFIHSFMLAWIMIRKSFLP